METSCSVEFFAINLACDHSSNTLEFLEHSKQETEPKQLRHMAGSIAEHLCKHLKPEASNQGFKALQLPSALV